MARLHVGCGRRILEGYINIDLHIALDFKYINLLPDTRILEADICNIPLPDECAEEILCEHVLEHLYPEQAHEALWELARLSRPGGLLKVSVPNFEYFVNNFHKLKDDPLLSKNMQYAILCNTRYADMSPHRSLWWFDSLRELVDDVGFEITYTKSETEDELYIEAIRRKTRVVRVANDN